MRTGLTPGFRRVAAVLAAILVTGSVVFLAARPALQRNVKAYLESKAARHGFVARIDEVRVGLWPPLRLIGTALEGPASARFTAPSVDVWWPGRIRLVVRGGRLAGPAGLSVAARETAWDIESGAGDSLRLTLTAPERGLVLARSRTAGSDAWTIDAADLAVGRLFDVRRFDRPILDGGTLRGSLSLNVSPEIVAFDVDATARAARLPALAAADAAVADLGAPTELSARFGGAWNRTAGTLDVPRGTATVDGATLSGALDLRDLETDPRIALSLEVDRLDFARLLRTSGLGAPGGFDGDPGAAAAQAAASATAGLGSASLVAAARGRLNDPASFVVTQKVTFTPPVPVPEAIARLRDPFTHEVETGQGRRTIDVSPSSPDFIALSDVPPLFLRTLLLAEDAGFYTHPGIDLREMPAALITDWQRGGPARGASTITQQLAKNLFLSHDKNIGRKLQELALTLLLESTLGKSRILEIYLNVIEWGPDLHGLRPAARAYFGIEPRELTPAQMVFLVSLIPAPIKYQSSFAHGTPGPGLRALMDALLAKLRSEGSLSDDDYARALDETIVVVGREPAAS